MVFPCSIRFFSDAVDMVAQKVFVQGTLRNYERNYHRSARDPLAARVDPVEWYRVWMHQKPPFNRGDDVWTPMEENIRVFVEEMSRR